MRKISDRSTQMFLSYRIIYHEISLKNENCRYLKKCSKILNFHRIFTKIYTESSATIYKHVCKILDRSKQVFLSYRIIYHEISLKNENFRFWKKCSKILNFHRIFSKIYTDPQQQYTNMCAKFQNDPRKSF